MGAHDPDHLIADYLTYLRGLGRAPSTRDKYGKLLHRLAAWLQAHDTDLLSAQLQHLESWQDHLVLSPNTLRGDTTTVKGFYRWLRRRARLRLDDPAEDLDRPRPPHYLPRPIGEAELELALDTAPERIRPWLVLAAFQGLRACEIAALDRSWLVETADPALLYIRGKGGRLRVVPVSPFTWTELHAYGLPRRGIVFRRHDGRPGGNTANLVSKLANEHLRACELDHTLHSLRHRFATIALRGTTSGNGLRVVQELLGHASASTTEIYTLVTSPEAVAAVNAAQPRRRLRAVRPPSTKES
jgi:integrase/recombinase XerC